MHEQASNKDVPLAHQIPQACHRIGVARTSLYELIKHGEIRAIKIGARTLIPESELLRFIANRLGT
jgi:excisionase family DNA binding protein